MKNFSFLIHAPSGVAGGCESLHQLADALNNLGIIAEMCYYPHTSNFSKPDKFLMYNVESAPFKDTVHTVHVFPEIYTKLSKKVKMGICCIFWLSIDNYYFKKDHYSFFERYKRYFLSLLSTRLPTYRMHKMIHLMQSEYSILHFKNKNFKQFYIGDYIDYDNIIKGSESRNDRVLYNPAKGFHITQKLMKENPEIEFLPLKGYNASELKKIMRDSKIYIDFGNHPGRDRMPREFVINGGVVVCGMRGSAKNESDIPLNGKYKLDESKTTFLYDAKKVLKDIINNYSDAQNDMINYRNILSTDKERHLNNVEIFVNHLQNNIIK